jgi:hypothetical protein
MRTQSFVLTLLLASSQAVQLDSVGGLANLQKSKGKFGESSNIGIDAESFADASI